MWIDFQIAGTAAFFAGVILLIIELTRRGLSRLSAFSYVCFVLSSIFLADNLLSGVLAVGGLSALFGVLLFFYRREQKHSKNRSYVQKDNTKDRSNL